MLETDNRPVHLYFDRNLENLNMSESDQQAVADLPSRCVLCKSWSEFPDLLQFKPRTISVNSNELNYSSAMEIVNMIRTMTKLVDLSYYIPITITIDNRVTTSQIKELQKSGIFGIIPLFSSFGLDEAIKGCLAQFANIPYWPKHIIDQLPGSKKKSEPLVKLEKIRLTTRQKQIFDMVVDRGSSNKIIARTLNISESTVKLHLGHIFKKYGVKSRTQLAVFARQE